MKKILLGFIIILSNYSLFSQSVDSKKEIQKKIYNNEDVQVKSEFPNGETKFNKFVVEKFKKKYHIDFPNSILLSFTVKINGSINDVVIISEVSNSTIKKIKKILKTSPRWTPGEHEGYRVKTKVITTLKPNRSDL